MSDFYIRPPGAILVMPYSSGRDGEFVRWRWGEAGVGENFWKTVIISRCPGVYNPGEAQCVINGGEISLASVTGDEAEFQRPEFLGVFQCYLPSNTQLYATIYQRDALDPETMMFDSSRRELTCGMAAAQCGMHISIRSGGNVWDFVDR